MRPAHFAEGDFFRRGQLLATIETAHLDRIFDRFYRIDPTRFNDGESHGFGLALVKAVARMHGGAVFARNEPGRICIGFTLSKAGRPPASTSG